MKIRHLFVAAVTVGATLPVAGAAPAGRASAMDCTIYLIIEHIPTPVLEADEADGEPSGVPVAGEPHSRLSIVTCMEAGGDVEDGKTYRQDYHSGYMTHEDGTPIAGRPGPPSTRRRSSSGGAGSGSGGTRSTSPAPAPGGPRGKKKLPPMQILPGRNRDNPSDQVPA